ncbi:acyclic terpene utilization AtuA family protein [Pendulispora rubella]|uniref:acyclic terpene utilization AtuA family protein n=1 Tax=Pendulispora rubella TaxID=2741070 RepID=UPI00374E015C
MSGQSPVRVANASGFLGDRARAFREMVEGGQVDVVTGDYLAEVTMLILGKQQAKDPAAGYAAPFLAHMEPALATVLSKGIKVVVNAGGLNPAGLAKAVRALGERLGLEPRVATVQGDDLRARLPALLEAGESLANLETGQALPREAGFVRTANAYLGAWGIVRALEAGADIVICPRVTDASLVVGAAAFWHGWSRDAWDCLAGAVAAGHVIECGTQATGGNYSSFQEISGLDHPGFPLAEIHADGRSVITKHPGTGGRVTVGTVTAQLVYEVDSTRYLNPDVVTHLDTIALSEEGPDRVALRGTRGSPPPETTKVAITTRGPFRNEMTLVAVGLDVDAKLALFERAARVALAKTKAQVAFQRIGSAKADAVSQDEASAFLRVVATSENELAVGRAFSSALVELGLGSYPGLFMLGAPGPAVEVGGYWPAKIPQSLLEHSVTLPDGSTESISVPPTPTLPLRGREQEQQPKNEPQGRERTGPQGERTEPKGQERTEPQGRERTEPQGRERTEPQGRERTEPQGQERTEPQGQERTEPQGSLPPRGRAGEGEPDTQSLPLGTLVDARSGDKGSDANVGLWVRTDEAFRWLRSFLTVERFRDLLPEAHDLAIERYEFPNLRAVNFVVRGLLRGGAVATIRFDRQAKALGEYLRSRIVDIPRTLLPR